MWSPFCSLRFHHHFKAKSQVMVDDDTTRPSIYFWCAQNSRTWGLAKQLSWDDNVDFEARWTFLARSCLGKVALTARCGNSREMFRQHRHSLQTKTTGRFYTAWQSACLFVFAIRCKADCFGVFSHLDLVPVNIHQDTVLQNVQQLSTRA